MNCFMILPFLLMATCVISGHSIKKLEINNRTEADVYEIKEDAGTNTIAFVNPKADKPTLREIVYYHMIERPYGGEEGPVGNETEEGPEFDETMRPFTNSHGFPFLEAAEKEVDHKDDRQEEDAVENKEEIALETPKEDDEYEVVYEIYYDEDSPATDDEKTGETIEEIPTTVAPEASEPNTAVTETSSLPETTEGHVIEDRTHPESITERSPKVQPTEDPDFETKAKTARKLLFDRVKERYYSKPNDAQNDTTTSERRKREIRMDIPEAPRLGKLNYESLSPYLRKMMSTEKPKTRNSGSESEEQERLNEYKDRIHKLLSNLKASDSHEETPKPRTYGMNLTDDSGYIWNDVTNPVMHYTVEASESTEQEIKKLRINSDSESAEEERLDDIKHRIHKLLSKLKTADNLDETPKPKPKPRTYGMNLTADSGYIWNDITNPGFHYTVEVSESTEEDIKEALNEAEIESDKSEEHKPEEFPNKEHTNHRHHDDEEVTRAQHKPEETHEKEHDKHGDNDKDEVTSAPVEDNDNSFEDKGRRRKHKEEEDPISQLMDGNIQDVFWDWLADWTSVYVDIITDHMIEAVKEEVAKQIKGEAEKHKEDNKETVEHKDIPEEPVKDKPTPDEIDTEKKNDVTKTTEEKDHENGEKTPKPIKNDEVATDIDNKDISNEHEEDLLRKRKDDKNKKDESPSNIKPVTNDRNNETKIDKGTTKVVAQNVYGNTMGEKITNIFIFYPNQDANKIIEDISKLNDSNHFNVDIRLNVTDENIKNDNSTQTSVEKNKESTEMATEINESSKDEVSKSNDTTQAPTERNKDVTEVTTEPITESSTTESPKITEESTESVTETTTSVQTTTIEKPDQVTTENEPTTTSSKVESTTAPNKVDEDSTKDQSKDDHKKDDDGSEKESLNEEKKAGVVDYKTEENQNNQETKENESTTEKTELKDENKEDIEPTTELLVNSENTTESPK